MQSQAESTVQSPPLRTPLCEHNNSLSALATKQNKKQPARMALEYHVSDVLTAYQSLRAQKKITIRRNGKFNIQQGPRTQPTQSKNDEPLRPRESEAAQPIPLKAALTTIIRPTPQAHSLFANKMSTGGKSTEYTFLQTCPKKQVWSCVEARLATAHPGHSVITPDPDHSLPVSTIELAALNAALLYVPGRLP